MRHVSRRKFVTSAVAASVAAGRTAMAQQSSNRVSGFDHAAVPMLNTDAMIAFYKKLGFKVTENPNAVVVYVGRNMINFHRPVRWQDPKQTLRAPAATPPCGDFCFVWDGTPAQLKAWVDAAGVRVEEGPVPRPGGRQAQGTS